MADVSARWRVAFAMHRCAPARQQDAVLVGAEVWPEDRLAPREALIETDVLAVLADGVATSPSAQFASRFVMMNLPQTCHNSDSGRGILRGRRPLRHAAKTKNPANCGVFDESRYLIRWWLGAGSNRIMRAKKMKYLDGH